MTLREMVIKALQPYIEVDPATEHEWSLARRYNAGLALDAILDTLSETLTQPGLAYDVGQRVWGGFGDTPEQFRDDAHENIEALIAALRDTETGSS